MDTKQEPQEGRVVYIYELQTSEGKTALYYRTNGISREKIISSEPNQQIKDIEDIAEDIQDLREDGYCPEFLEDRPVKLSKEIKEKLEAALNYL